MTIVGPLVVLLAPSYGIGHLVLENGYRMAKFGGPHRVLHPYGARRAKSTFSYDVSSTIVHLVLMGLWSPNIWMLVTLDVYLYDIS